MSDNGTQLVRGQQSSYARLIAAHEALEAIRDLSEGDEEWNDRIDEVSLAISSVLEAKAEDTADTAEEPGWGVLLEAADEVEIVLDRAACGEWPLPATPGDFMAWLADEAEIQTDFLADDIHEDERSQRGAYVRRLCEIVRELKEAGVTPSRLPWEKKSVYAYSVVCVKVTGVGGETDGECIRRAVELIDKGSTGLVAEPPPTDGMDIPWAEDTQEFEGFHVVDEETDEGKWYTPDGETPYLSANATHALLEMGWDVLLASCDDLAQEVLGHRMPKEKRLAALDWLRAFYDDLRSEHPEWTPKSIALEA